VPALFMKGSTRKDAYDMWEHIIFSLTEYNGYEKAATNMCDSAFSIGGAWFAWSLLMQCYFLDV
jgi:hypothetical protein